MLLDAIKDEDEAVTHAASHVLTQAITLKPELKKSIEEAAASNPETRTTLIKATEKSLDLKKAIDISKIQRIAVRQ